MHKLRSSTFLSVVALLVLGLSSCSSNDSGQMSEQMPDQEQMPDPAPAVFSSRTSFELISQLPYDDAVFADVNSPLPHAVSDDGTRVLIKGGFTDENDTFARRFFNYDVLANSATVSNFTPVRDAFPAFDSTWATMAYANGCQASVQQVALSEPISLSGIHGFESLCANSQTAQISDDGETLLMPSSRIDDGGNVPLIFGVSGGTVTVLDSEFLQQADAALAGRLSTAYDPSLSADGRYVAATLVVTDGPVPDGQTINFSVGTVIVDTRTAEARVVGLSEYQRFSCGRCAFVPVTAPAISGNGRYVVYEQAPEIAVNPGEEPTSNTTLFRYDIESGDTQQLHSSARGTSEIVVSGSGARVAWRVGADVQIAYVDSDEIISLQDGFRFCADGLNDCLFTNARFVTSTAIEMSGDGSALTVYLIPQQNENASPADRPELLHFDLGTGTLSRVAPGASGSFHALSHDGDTVALVWVDERRVETIAVLQKQ